MPEKMKCARCGKRFKQTNKKQVFCAECLAQDRAAKKSAPQLVRSSTGYGASSSSNHPTAGTQTSGITIVATTPPPEVGGYGVQARNAERHAPHAPPSSPQAPTATPVQNPPATTATIPKVAAPQPPQKKPSAPSEKRVRQPRPAIPPFQLTDEMRATIEQRYLELSQPVEFDGIRTQIAIELAVPKPVVKQVIKELRASRQLPSWWELQAYKGNEEALERVRERYLPLLPVPPVGVHKQIASELQMDAPQVYQAIRRLRAEMKQPQYNSPDLHESEKPPIEDFGAMVTDSTVSASPDS
jgi:hypothetical protein